MGENMIWKYKRDIVEDIVVEERLTWDEIVEKYPDQWVGLVDIDILAPMGVFIQNLKYEIC